MHSGGLRRGWGGGFAVLLHQIEPDKRNPPICLSCFFFYLFGLPLRHRNQYVGGGWGGLG